MNIVDQLECLATKEQQLKIKNVRGLKEKIFARDNDVKKAISEFRKREFGSSKTVGNLGSSGMSLMGDGGQNPSRLSNGTDDADMLDYERQKNAEPSR